MNINEFIERLNIEFIKNKYLDQSQIIINRYNIDLNSKEITFNKKIKTYRKRNTNYCLLV